MGVEEQSQKKTKTLVPCLFPSMCSHQVPKGFPPKVPNVFLKMFLIGPHFYPLNN